MITIVLQIKVWIVASPQSVKVKLKGVPLQAKVVQVKVF